MGKPPAENENAHDCDKREKCDVNLDGTLSSLLDSLLIDSTRQDVSVSGPLSPFDEGVSVAFRGPLNLHNIVWYEGTKDSLTKTSSWTPT